MSNNSKKSSENIIEKSINSIELETMCFNIFYSMMSKYFDEYQTLRTLSLESFEYLKKETFHKYYSSCLSKYNDKKWDDSYREFSKEQLFGLYFQGRMSFIRAELKIQGLPKFFIYLDMINNKIEKNLLKIKIQNIS